MTTLETILSIILYVIIMFLSIKPFKLLKKKNIMEMPVIAAILWPSIWTIISIMALFYGYIEIFKKE